MLAGYSSMCPTDNRVYVYIHKYIPSSTVKSEGPSPLLQIKRPIACLHSVNLSELNRQLSNDYTGSNLQGNKKQISTFISGTGSNYGKFCLFIKMLDTAHQSLSLLLDYTSNPDDKRKQHQKNLLANLKINVSGMTYFTYLSLFLQYVYTVENQ